MLPNQTHDDPANRSATVATIMAASPFSDLPEQVVGILADAASRRPYTDGETILAMGQFDGSEFLIVESGKIKVSLADPKTGSMIFESVGPGEAYGLALALVGADQAHLSGISVAADRDSVIVAVDAEALRNVARERPSLTRNLMLHFARRLAGDNREAAEETTPERRVYAALSSYIERDAVSAEWRIARMPKHRELADRANVEEADAANAVAKLIQSGVARRNYPGLVIEDISQLNRLAR